MIINPNRPGYVVNFKISYVDLESCCDFIYVHDGPSTSDP